MMKAKEKEPTTNRNRENISGFFFMFVCLVCVICFCELYFCRFVEGKIAGISNGEHIGEACISFSVRKK